MFDDLELIGHFGSWVRVQAAFYDFIFQEGAQLCAAHWREKAIRSFDEGTFAEGEDSCEKSLKAVEQRFLSFENAWIAFRESIVGKITFDQRKFGGIFLLPAVRPWAE